MLSGRCKGQSPIPTPVDGLIEAGEIERRERGKTLGVGWKLGGQNSKGASTAGQGFSQVHCAPALCAAAL